MIDITIPGNPIAKARPKFARRGKFVTTYNPQESEESRFMAQVLSAIGQKMPEKGPVVLKVKFFLKRNRGAYGTGKNAGKLKLSAPRCHTKKPDLDNLVKFVKDALNGIAWGDDSQVVELAASKHYADFGAPRTELFIRGIE